MPKKILIVGSFGSSNIGDEAMLEVILKNLPEEAEKYILSGKPKFTERVYGVPASIHLPFGIKSFFSFRWIRSYRFLWNADLVLIGGGGLFTDAETVMAVLLWAWHVFWAKIFRKKVILFANSVGPVNTKMGKFVTRWVLNKCDEIILRDEHSISAIKELAPNLSYSLGSDIAFLHPHEKKSEDNWQKNTQRFMALSLRSWDINYEPFNDLINNMLSQGFKVLLVPMEDSDYLILEQFIRDNVFIVNPQNFGELLDILHSCELAIGMRLHFLIAASIANCKVGGISYSAKVKGILDKLNIPYVYPENLTLDLLMQLAEKAKTAENIDEEKKLAEEMFMKLNKHL